MSGTGDQAGLRDKLMEPMNAIIDRKRTELLPMLQGGAGQTVQAALRDDECMRKVAVFCYPLLPGLVRLAIKEPVFVNFVLNHREQVLSRLSAQVA